MRSLKALCPTAKGMACGGLIVLLTAGLFGCDKNGSEASQVIARVNSDDISVHQLNSSISQEANKIPSLSEREALIEKMIDRQLALQQSLAQGLDRRPEVMLRLEEARRDILAAAYAEEISGKLEAPNDEAGARYFGEHPGLFANRKVYRLREISLPEGSSVLAEVQSRLERKESVTVLVSWLRSQPGRFGDQSTLRAAEQLPVEIVDRLSQLKRSETIAFRSPRALVIYEVQSAEAAPVTWTMAAPMIKAHLAKQNGVAAFKEELKRLRAMAKISRQPLKS